MNYSLHEHEKAILVALKKPMDQQALAVASGLKPDSVAHASLWLVSKGLVKMDEERTEKISLGKEGKEYLAEGLPERQALKLMGKGSAGMAELKKKLGPKKFGIAMTWLMKKRLATADKGDLVLTEYGKKALKKKTSDEEALDAISSGKKVPGSAVKLLKSRGGLINATDDVKRTVQLTAEGKKLVKKGLDLTAAANLLTPKMLRDGSWEKTKFRPYEVEAVVPRIYPGRRHFVRQATDYVRKVWLEMGFQEMEGSLINTSFWNFDALFTSQEHPVREMQDTFFVDPESGKLPDSAVVERVKKAHEIGTRDSIGWDYAWDPEVAKKRVLRTHTTVLSARTIAALKKEDFPAKYFSVGRCFRNEALDWSHLFEFNQVEGIVVDPDVNFKHLLGYLKQFFGKLGFEKARFRPAYFPYTEMSIEIDVLHPGRGEWIELGGAGIFRPEVVEPLLGLDVPVLAWGPGFDRIIMDYYAIHDIRDLYKNDVQQLRTMKHWMRG
ncbi:phenylalanine--tRNA ligase subunit alpha [archaeon]